MVLTEDGIMSTMMYMQKSLETGITVDQYIIDNPDDVHGYSFLAIQLQKINNSERLRIIDTGLETYGEHYLLHHNF